MTCSFGSHPVLIEIPMSWRTSVFFLSGRESSSSVLHFISVLWQNKLPNARMQRTFPTPYLVTLGLWCEYIKLAESNKSFSYRIITLFAAAILIPHLW